MPPRPGHVPSRRALLRSVTLVAAGLGSGCLSDGGASTLDACPDSPTIDAPGPPASRDEAPDLVSWAKRVERAVQQETMRDDEAIGRIERRSVDVEADPPTVTLDVSLRDLETETPPPADSDLWVVTYRVEADRVVRIKKGHPARREIGRDCWEVAA